MILGIVSHLNDFDYTWDKATVGTTTAVAELIIMHVLAAIFALARPAVHRSLHYVNVSQLIYLVETLVVELRMYQLLGAVA